MDFFDQERWEGSAEWRAIRVWQQILKAVVIVGGAAAFIFWLAILANGFENNPEESVPIAVWIVAGALTVVTAVLGVVTFAQRGLARTKFEDREDEERRTRLRAARDDKVDTGRLGELMKANRELLDEYQRPVRTQARTSYIYGQAAIFLGLIVLLAGAGLVLTTNSTSGRISLAGLAAVGSAISGYVGRTFLRVYERAQEQLNFYFREPLITSYLLTSERLAEELQGESKSRMYELMIQEIVSFAKAGAQAQPSSDG
jgi:hypothetical protein